VTAGRTRRAGPDLRVERRLLRSGIRRLGAMDEVGRGSPAGPVVVGVVVIDAAVTPAPRGVRDSKLLTPQRREALVPAIEGWVCEWAIGRADAVEVDSWGLTAALRLAGERALALLVAPVDLVLLDGAHDWLTPPEPSGPGDAAKPASGVRPPVVTRVRADRTCSSVAAASVLAKVDRDALMVGLSAHYPGYGWEDNKGYGTPAHLEAIGRLGPTPHHRTTWRISPV